VSTRSLGFHRVGRARFQGFCLFACLLSVLMISCRQRSSPDATSDRTSFQRPGEVTKPVDIREAQKEIYDLWMYAEELSPFSLVEPRSAPAERDRLTQELNSMSFVAYPERQRHSFRRFRDSIVECASSTEKARCVVEERARLNILLADWKLDRVAADSFNNSQFADFINSHETFMKELALLTPDDQLYQRRLSGCPLVYGELYRLADRLMGTDEYADDYNTVDEKAAVFMAHATRVGIMGVNTATCNRTGDRAALVELRAQLMEISQAYGDGRWVAKRSDLAVPLILDWRKTSITEKDYIGTQFHSISDSIRQMRRLTGGPRP